MAKLHELLAVEGDLEGVAKRILQETGSVFRNKPNLFNGYHKELRMFDEDRQQDNTSETQNVTTTVPDRLEYTMEHLVKYWDAIYQKERTNQNACADLVVNGETIATDVPATFLLGMETRLKQLRQAVEQAPTLQPGVEWVPAPEQGPHIHRTYDREERFKTEKTFNHKVLYEATQHHPAQIERWEENRNVGKYLTQTWSGAISSAKKQQYIDRVDQLIRAVKKARQRANTEPVVTENIGEKFASFIMGG